MPTPDADAMRAARETLGLTKSQLATLLGYGAVQRIDEIERGARRPGMAVLRLLAAYRDGYRPADWPGQSQGSAP